MEDLKEYTCTFLGHRNTERTDELYKKVYSTAEKLITENGVKVFLFGSASRFNKLCYDAVTVLKEKYPHIKRIYVRGEFPHISESYHNKLLLKYEETYYPEKIINSGRAVYIKRNYEMVEKSRFLICFYDENYLPPMKKSGKSDVFPYQPKSGTALAFSYAKKKGLVIFNMF